MLEFSQNNFETRRCCDFKESLLKATHASVLSEKTIEACCVTKVVTRFPFNKRAMESITDIKGLA